MGGRLYVPDLPAHSGSRGEILHEAHYSRFTVHPGTAKMYHDICIVYWWPGLKKDALDTVSKCLVCQQVKIDHQRPGGLLQPLPLPEWKWDCVTYDFITHLPTSRIQMDTVWVIVDRLKKSAHFIPIRMTYPVSTLARLYQDQIVRLHGVPWEIVLDKDPRFTSSFWRSFQRELGTETRFSTTYHPQTDGQSERTIQILEDLLRSCVMDFGRSWEEHLPLVEFAYNNSYQVSIWMASFEALYGRPCRSPTCWLEGEEQLLVGPELLQDSQRTVELIR